MRLIVSAILVTLTWLCAAPAQAQICKWVDDRGVIHYESECPDEGEGDVLDIDTKPVEGPNVDLRPAAETAEEEFPPQLHDPSAQESIKVMPPQPSLLQDDEALERCVQATTNLVILQVEAPVFYDDEGVLHHGMSAAAREYEGPRTYVDDDDRAGEIRQYENYLSENCGRSEAEREEVAERVTAQRLQSIQDEICADRETLLNRLDGGLTGLPSPSVQELRAYIANNCN